MDSIAARSFALCALWLGGIGAAVACSSASSNGAGPAATADAATDGAASETSVGATDPQGMFRALQADLISTCGGSNGQCHVSGAFMGAPTWLGPPDPYVSCKNYPGNIPASNDPLDSKILTQVTHEGPSLVTSQDLFNRVRAWVVAEIAARGAKLPATAEIAVVNGTNTIDLSALAGGLSGTTLSFTASSSGKILTILNMKITAPQPRGLHIENPFYVIIPSNGPTITDTTDGFSGSLDVPMGQTVDFYDGSSVLTTWDPAGKLKIVFNAFAAVLPGDAGAGGNCTNVSAFTTNAAPAFKLDLGGGNTCQGCHAGGNQAAQFAMDLAALDSDPAAACAQVLHRIVPKDPTNSQILMTPTGQSGGDTSHPVRDVCPSETSQDGGGPDLCTPQAFIDGMTQWINAE